MRTPDPSGTNARKPLRFILVGGSGYIAPKHRAAIRHVGGQLIALHDPHQNVGFLNREFPNCKYYKEPWRFLRRLWKWQAEGQAPDYGVICTPNHLHDPMAVTLMKFGMDVIVEKPTCILPRTIDLLAQAEQEEGRRVWTVLQTKYHPTLEAKAPELQSGHHTVELRWTTDRSDWYYWTWKNSPEQSGGLIYNIGSHFLHLLGVFFGDSRKVVVTTRTKRDLAGEIEFERARVSFDLSIDPNRPPERSMTIDGQQLVFTDGFDQLHNRVYEEILTGRGIGLEEVRDSIKLADMIQHTKLTKRVPSPTGGL